ncbi:STAS domain-containing protein [Streptomyces sp. NPDC058320]|uniref:STAS domain-containing protein n=1 Tax=unclassified Streptomyces TaxID=2593676 RepID=UPI0036307A13
MDALTGSAGQRLVLDLTGLDECDSGGISALLSARSLAIDQGGGIALVARVPANTTRILGIVGLDQGFTIHADAATATASSSVTH